MMVQFGIWIFDEKIGIIGRPENDPELYVSPEKIWDVQETTRGQVWKWPISFARLGWFTPRVADNFNKAFFYAQQFFEAFRPESLTETLDMDARTVQVQTEMLSDYFPGPDEELSVRA